MEKIQIYSQKFTLFCAFAACFCFAHSNLMTITMVTWLIAWFIEITLNWNKVKFDTPNKNNIPLYLTLALFLWMIISLIWTENFQRAMRLFEMRIPLLLFPLFALCGMKEEKNFRKLLLAFAAGTIIYSIIVPIQTYCAVGEQMKAEPESASIYFTREFNDIKHRTQLGLLQLISLCIIHYLKPQIVKMFNGKTLLYHLLLCICFSIVAFVLYISEGRSMLGMYLLLVLVLTFNFLWRNKLRIIAIAFVPAVLIGGGIVFKNHPRMQDFSFKKEELQRFDPRYEQWRCAYHCIKADSHNMLIGEGIGDYTDVFNEMHESPEFKEHYYEIYSTHNQWLDGQMEYGLIGGLILLGIFITNVLFIKDHETSLFVYLFTFLLIAYSFVEQMFGRSMPINTLCFFLLFTYWAKIYQPDHQQDKLEI